MSRCFRILLTSAAVFIAPTIEAQPAQPAPAADSLLNRLLGSWSMTGRVRGTAVQYRMSATRVLAGRFVEVHMIDTARVPQYEARVFVGADTVSRGVLVHWLDNFGAAYSVPHGIGTVHGDTLQFLIGYNDGPFRDTFVYRGPQRGWYFRLESGDGRGTWTLFAEYEVTRLAAPAR